MSRAAVPSSITAVLFALFNSCDSKHDVGGTVSVTQGQAIASAAIE